ncbi:hypothetical protein NMY22_g15326 [Coprinellus aureogranulatus]|nr:hypothetical protein NMY22_g15326 [Coprinellus aureogranulatus]
MSIHTSHSSVSASFLSRDLRTPVLEEEGPQSDSVEAEVEGSEAEVPEPPQRTDSQSSTKPGFVDIEAGESAGQDTDTQPEIYDVLLGSLRLPGQVERQDRYETATGFEMGELR